MKKFLSVFFVLVLAVVGRAADVDQAVCLGATGTTSASVIVPAGSSPLNITDLMTRYDIGGTSQTVTIRTGKSKLTASKTIDLSHIAFTNTGSAIVPTSGYALYYTATNGVYTLVRVQVATTGVNPIIPNLAASTTANDWLYPLATDVLRPALNAQAPSTTVGATSIWLPANAPSVLTLDGNTTSCQIEASGVRSSGK